MRSASRPATTRPASLRPCRASADDRRRSATSRTQRFIEPPAAPSPVEGRSDEYASDAPSGDHAGSASTHASRVSRCGEPASGITHRSPTAVNATCVPSGDTTGCTMPRTGCGPERSNASALRRERGTRERHVCRELDHSGGAARGRPPFDLAVGGVEHLGLRHPLGTERKDVLVRVGDVRPGPVVSRPGSRRP